MEYSFGIMEGRLTPSNGRGIQFFPFENWKEEFYAARELGIDEIEFIFDYDDYERNPLWIGKGQQVGKMVCDTGVKVKSVCFDYFMRRPFYKFPLGDMDELRRENELVLLRILENMKEQGIGLIEIPLVDNSSIKTIREKELFIEFISMIIDLTPSSIKFGFEADFAPDEFVDFLNNFSPERVGANYDTGNSSGIGYNPKEELEAYGNRILNIHIKDRKLGGTTMKLGTGSADFDSFFANLANCNYSGSFIMQAARTEDGTEKENIKEQIQFVKDYISKYL